MSKNILHGALAICLLFVGIEPAQSLEHSELVSHVSERLGLGMQEADKLVTGVFGEIQNRLAAGEPVRVRKFGLFTVKDRAARSARNPKTGQAIEVPARRYARFRAADTLNKTLNLTKE